MNTLLEAVRNSDSVGLAICLLLFLASVGAWAMMIGKRGTLATAARRDGMFRRRYKVSLHPAQYYLQAGGSFRRGIPMADIYAITVKELLNFLHRNGLSDEAILGWQPGFTGPALPESEMATVRAAAESALSESLVELESNMPFLATCTSAAPSLGLFGTVWGIMRAFMDMVGAKDGASSMIQDVAPGISSALLTTVVGLFVAIPSAIGYNFLSARVRRQTVELENFTDMLLADIVRVHGSSVGGARSPVSAPSSFAASSFAASAPTPLPPSPADRV